MADHLIKFLIDTGPTFLVLTQSIANLNDYKKYVMGVSGKRQGHIFLRPLLYNIKGWLFPHSFLFVPDCPISLMEATFKIN